jgi:hypothetical protein
VPVDRVKSFRVTELNSDARADVGITPGRHSEWGVAPPSAREVNMTAAARSVFAFGVYLVVLGAILIGSPNTLLALVRLPATTDPWIHVLGVAVMGMGIQFLAAARAEQTAFMRATVGARLFAFAALLALALLNVAPLVVAAFGLADLAGAIWTFTALRRSAVQVAAVSR